MSTIAPEAQSRVASDETFAAAAPESEDAAAKASFRLLHDRTLLRFLKVDPDIVDMSSVITVSSLQDTSDWGADSTRSERLVMNVSWRSTVPAREGQRPDSDGLFPDYDELADEDLVQFLNALTGP